VGRAAHISIKHLKTYRRSSVLSTVAPWTVTKRFSPDFSVTTISTLPFISEIKKIFRLISINIHKKKSQK
jgi:hypothetical protein